MWHGEDLFRETGRNNCAVKTYSAGRCTSIAVDGCAKGQREAVIYICAYISVEICFSR